MRPLEGIKVIEMAGLAPSPYCGMLLSDFGADVVIVDRLSEGAPEIPNIMAKNPFDRGKRSMRVNLKTDRGVEIIRKMISSSDVLLEPYRPGVMEAMKLGRGIRDKSQADLCSPDRLGPGRPICQYGRTRYQLYCSFGRPVTVQKKGRKPASTL
jgi:hypothetical protein